jgi:guanine nucleotide-binding protein G(i) subunit alpha
MVASMQVILDNMLLLGMPLSDSSLRDKANFIVSLHNDYGSVGLDSSTGDLLPGVLEAIIALWADTNVQNTVVMHSNEFQLNDSAEYFLNSAARIGSRDWKPSDMDVLKARVKTTGVSVTSFKKHDRKFDVVDVGGQRSERRKWL